MTNKNVIINSDREIMGGIPVFKGTRVLIKNLLDYLEAGDSLDTFLDHFFPNIDWLLFGTTILIIIFLHQELDYCDALPYPRCRNPR